LKAVAIEFYKIAGKGNFYLWEILTTPFPPPQGRRGLERIIFYVSISSLLELS